MNTRKQRMDLQKTEEPHQTHPIRKKQRNKPQLGKKKKTTGRGFRLLGGGEV